MTINILQVMVFNIFVIAISISLVMLLLIGFITRYLDTKSKSNKIRQWWSKYICDLDDRYGN